jgi:hypothetical protein
VATYSHRTITSTRREWIIPTTYLRGACLGDMEAAIGAAAQDYRHYFNLSDAVALPDDALMFTTTDESIVISFTVEQPAI